ALPRALEDAAKALGLPVEKDAAGARLMKQMAKPRRPTKNDPREWWDDEDRRRRLYDYCKQDVRVERAVAKKLRRLSSHERELYLLDQKVNDRGVRVDVQLVHAAKRIVSIAEERADAKLAVLTDGAVTSISQRDKTKEWLNNRGVEIDNLRKDTLRDLLASPDELGAIERAVAELRADNAKSSTKKLDKFLTALGDDDRIRDLLLYHGAGTGRWSGKLIQPQNFPRGEYWSNTGQLVRLKNVEQYIPLVLAGDFDGLADSGHPPLAIISALLRSMLIASPGHRLVAADFSQIEARVLAWIAEQDDLVEMF